jgi:hypothetical protein
MFTTWTVGVAAAAFYLNRFYSASVNVTTPSQGSLTVQQVICLNGKTTRNPRNKSRDPGMKAPLNDLEPEQHERG